MADMFQSIKTGLEEALAYSEGKKVMVREFHRACAC